MVASRRDVEFSCWGYDEADEIDKTNKNIILLAMTIKVNQLATSGLRMLPVKIRENLREIHLGSTDI